jgi:hypothetical protein
VAFGTRVRFAGARIGIEMNELRALTRGIQRVFDRRLSGADCCLLASVALIEAAATAAMAITTVSRARRFLGRIRPAVAAAVRRTTEPRLVWAIEASARWRFGRATCLARALAAEVLLQPSEHDAQSQRIVIGVTSPRAGVLRSHAWLERDGRILTGGADSPRLYERLVAWDSPR